MKKFILFYCLSMVAEKGFSQMKDTIFFNNGSMVIGKIKKIKLGIVTFDPDDANDITVQLRNLRTIAAEREVYRVETIDEHVYYGQLIPHPSNGFVRFTNGVDTSTILVQEISIMYPYGEAFLQRFTGDVGLGYNYTRSSDFGRLNFDGTLNYTSSKIVISLTFSGIYTFTDSAFSRDNENFAIKTNYYFTPSWFGTVFFNYQRNLELGLQRRYQEGFGVGNKLITNKHVYMFARDGIVFNQEKSTQGITTGTLTEFFGQVEFNFFRFTKPKVDMLLAQTVYYSLSQNRFRNDGTTKVNWELVKNFKLSLEFYNNYDSKPLAEGSKFDYGILFGFSYFFY